MSYAHSKGDGLLYLSGSTGHYGAGAGGGGGGAGTKCFLAVLTPPSTTTTTTETTQSDEFGLVDDATPSESDSSPMVESMVLTPFFAPPLSEIVCSALTLLNTGENVIHETIHSNVEIKLNTTFQNAAVAGYWEEAPETAIGNDPEEGGGGGEIVSRSFVLESNITMAGNKSNFSQIVKGETVLYIERPVTLTAAPHRGYSATSIYVASAVRGGGPLMSNATHIADGRFVAITKILQATYTSRWTKAYKPTEVVTVIETENYSLPNGTFVTNVTSTSEFPGADVSALLYVTRDGTNKTAAADDPDYDEDILIMVGTTAGYGPAFGSSVKSSGDLDGYVTKLSAITGEETKPPSDDKDNGDRYGHSVHSIRIQSQPKRHDILQGACGPHLTKGEIYIVGSTTGAIAGPSADDTAQPFIMALDIATLDVEWKTQLNTESTGGGAATGCSISKDGKGVYVTGMVMDGDVVEPIAHGTNSSGGHDAFVAWLDREDGKPLWVRQFGTVHNDVPAPGSGGIESLVAPVAGVGGIIDDAENDGGVAIYGTTTKSGVAVDGDDGTISPGDASEVFVTTVSPKGIIVGEFRLQTVEEITIAPSSPPIPSTGNATMVGNATMAGNATMVGNATMAGNAMAAGDDTTKLDSASPPASETGTTGDVDGGEPKGSGYDLDSTFHFDNSPGGSDDYPHTKDNPDLGYSGVYPHNTYSKEESDQPLLVVVIVVPFAVVLFFVVALIVAKKRKWKEDVKKAREEAAGGATLSSTSDGFVLDGQTGMELTAATTADATKSEDLKGKDSADIKVENLPDIL